MKKTVLTLLMIMFSISFVFAQNKIDINVKRKNNLIKFGAGWLFLNTSSSDLIHISPDLGLLNDTFTPPGYKVDLKNIVIAAGSYTRFIGEHFGIETLIGLPFKVSVIGKGEASEIGEIATTKVLAPTFFFNYYLTNRKSIMRPYLSLAINHALFFDIKESKGINEALRGDTQMKFSPSTDIGGFAGINYQFKRRYFASLMLGYLRVASSADITTLTNIPILPDITINRKLDLDINPFVVLATLGYSF